MLGGKKKRNNEKRSESRFEAKRMLKLRAVINLHASPRDWAKESARR